MARSILAGAAVVLLVGGVAVGRVAQARGNASPAAQTASHTIVVNGHGEVTVPPDQATISVGVQTPGTTAQEALASNASKMNAVIQAIEGQGVPADHIQTSNLSIYLDSERDRYIATNNVTVKITSIGKVGAVLDAAVGAGANNSWGVSFGLQNSAAAEAQALQAAVTNGRGRANAIASALGVTISGVQSATEPTYTSRVVAPVAAAPVSAPGAGTPVQPGTLTVTADLNIVYTFG